MPLYHFNFAVALKMLSGLRDWDHQQISLFINEEMSEQRQNLQYENWYKRKVFLNNRRCMTLFFFHLIRDTVVEDRCLSK